MLVDAGPLIAAADTDDRHHDRCVELLRSEPRPLIVPMLAVTEVAYFLSARIGAAAEHAFAASFRAGEMAAEPLEPADWERIDGLLTEYEDLDVGIVDASVLAACERLGETRLATLDRRHFSVMRPQHCGALTLLPE